MDPIRRHCARKKRWLPRLYVLVLLGMLILSLTGILVRPASAAAWMGAKATVTVRYHGKTTRTTGFPETAGDLLNRLKLEISGEDVVSHGLEEPVFDGMVLTVDRVVTVEETYAVTIPHSVVRCSDPSGPEGTQQILTEGSEGELLRTARVTYKNGRETDREVLQETVLRPPVDQVLALGTGAPAAPESQLRIGDGFITLPTGEVLTYTGTATLRATAYTHTDQGCDFITATGTTVRWGTVAVDPRYIPYGTRMFIVSQSGSYVYGLAVAEDCGGDIKGDRMDLYMPTYEQCMDFGRRVCTVYFLG